MLEIERKFLISEDNLPPKSANYPHYFIRQGYITADAHAAVRLRQKADACYITVKYGKGTVRQEYEGLIPLATFEALWPTTAGKRLEKTRYEIPGPNALTIELDIYEGQLKGLITAEVEFDSAEAADCFHPPTWFGADVTLDSRYTNARLAVDGLPA